MQSVDEDESFFIFYKFASAKVAEPRIQNLTGFEKMTDRKEHFVMIPFMAQGHIIPFIALALQIEKRRRCSITMVNTPLNIKRIRASLPPDSAIRVQEVPFCSTDFGLPPNSENTSDLPYHLILPLFEASMSLEPSFRQAVEEIVQGENGGATICLITDIYFSWCAEIAREFEIFHAIFSVVPAFSMACYYSVCRNLPHRKTESEEFILPDFPEASKIHITQLSKSLQSADGTDVFSLFSNAIFQECVNADAMLINTIEEVDEIGLNYFRKKGEGPVWATGPLLLPAGKRVRAVKEGEIESELCISWLDTKPVSSVLYVSFGSQNTPSKSQMMQLAMALEASGKSFIWVVRPPLECDDINAKFNFDEWLPEGFSERMKSENRGILIEKWAPQVEILSHKSTSAFLTQCGWNSVMESLIHGVPVLGWAMATEQFFTVKQLDEHLGVCVEVARGKSCEINHEQIRAKIELLMNDTEKGREVREKTLRVKTILENAMKDEGGYTGSSAIALDEFITTAISGTRN